MFTAIIQARMGSSRLPAKVMKNIIDRPVLGHVVERVKKATKIDQVIVATTTDAADREIINYCRANNINVFAGSEDDVLDRYYRTALEYGLSDEDAVLRVTADCPLIDPQIIDQLLELFLDMDVDYASNVIPPTYPDGLDAEVMSFAALKKAWTEAKLSSEREHVTPYIIKHPELFSQANLKNVEDLSKLRWTVDETEDLELVRAIYRKMGAGREFFMNDILKCLEENPEIMELNRQFRRNEGYEKSLLKDAQEIAAVKAGEANA